MSEHTVMSFLASFYNQKFQKLKKYFKDFDKKFRTKNFRNSKTSLKIRKKNCCRKRIDHFANFTMTVDCLISVFFLQILLSEKKTTKT